MTLTAWNIYWITRFDSIQAVLRILALACGVFGFVGLLGYALSEGTLKVAGTFAKWLLPTTAAMLLVAAFVPSTRSAAAMVVLPAIVNSEVVQQIPTELTTLVREWLQELHPDKKEHK